MVTWCINSKKKKKKKKKRGGGSRVDFLIGLDNLSYDTLVSYDKLSKPIKKRIGYNMNVIRQDQLSRSVIHSL